MQIIRAMNIKIKKGLDLRLAGGINDLELAKKTCKTINSSVCAITPDDFPGFKAKATVKEGDKIKAGDALLFNKEYEDLKLVSPFSGTVKAIVRGERRKILRVEVESDNSGEKTMFDPSWSGAEEIVTKLAQSGILARFRERPYDIVPSCGISKVRDIYVMAFDEAPLSVSGILVNDDPELGIKLQAAADILSHLTFGNVYFAINPEVENYLVKKSISLRGVETVVVDGPYPASLAGTVIAKTEPINKGERVWTLGVDTMIRIGELFTKGHYNFENTVAITGSEIITPGLIKALDGASLKQILEGNLCRDERKKRIISGNVLTGIKDSEDGFLHFPYRQVTVIPEGDDQADFMGWASISPSKISAKPSFPLGFLKKTFSPDARIKGGRRAMIMSGEYGKYFPMDILPEFLIKAITSKDIDAMERLGIYEVAPEDFALAEFGDTSKLPLQTIVREGLDYLRKELE